MHRYMQCMRAYAKYASEQDIEGTNTGIECTRGFGMVNWQMLFNRLTFLVIVYFVSHTEHTVCIIEKSGRLIHNHFVRVQDFLLKHLQR